MKPNIRLLIILLLPWLILSEGASGEVYDTIDQKDWVELIEPDYNSIFFTEYPEFTTITDHYEDLGVLFTDGDDGIIHGSSYDDGAGLTSAFTDDITLEFLRPQTAIGVKFPGDIRIDLYLDEELFFTSNDFSDVLSDFGGLISDTPFDKAVIYDPTGFTYIDDVYFGQAIPAPGALPLLGLALLGHQRRRRR